MSVELAIQRLREQQSTVKERSPQWMVARQLMAITEAEKKIKVFADSHKTGSFSCVTPEESDRILREFYGLPPRPGAEDGLEPAGGLGLDLADFWG